MGMEFGSLRATEEEKESQPSLCMAEKLAEQRSKFKRSNFNSPNCELEIGDKRFISELIENGESLELSKVQQLLIDTFGEEEVDPEEILRTAVDGKTPWDIPDETKYLVTVIKNEQDEVVSMLSGGLLELCDNNDEPTGEAVFMVAYAVTSSNARQGGLAREVYISGLIAAAKQAEERGIKLAFAAGECTYTSERFWNSVGWKRIYAAENPDEIRAYKELEYIQPALDFDEETGEIAEDAGEAPEHIMIDSFDKRPPTKEEIKRTVHAFYRWSADWPEKAFENKKAYKKQVAYMQKLRKKFMSGLDKSGQLIYLDQESREKAKAQGVFIQDYSAADKKEETGEEDF